MPQQDPAIDFETSEVTAHHSPIINHNVFCYLKTKNQKPKCCSFTAKRKDEVEGVLEGVGGGCCYVWDRG